MDESIRTAGTPTSEAHTWLQNAVAHVQQTEVLLSEEITSSPEFQKGLTAGLVLQHGRYQTIFVNEVAQIIKNKELPPNIAIRLSQDLYKIKEVFDHSVVSQHVLALQAGSGSSLSLQRGLTSPQMAGLLRFGALQGEHSGSTSSSTKDRAPSSSF